MKINIKVFPKSRKQEIIKISNRDFKVYLKNPAKEGKANLELIKVLKKYFKDKLDKKYKIYDIKNKFLNTQTSKKKHEVYDIKIIKGLRSRNKVVEIGENGD